VNATPSEQAATNSANNGIELALLQRDMAELRADMALTNAKIDKQTAAIELLTGAFNTAKFGAALIKWICVVAAACAGIWVAVSRHEFPR
jgi:hypothetical protein